jgi:hypothetical protein
MATVGFVFAPHSIASAFPSKCHGSISRQVIHDS